MTKIILTDDEKSTIILALEKELDELKQSFDLLEYQGLHESLVTSCKKNFQKEIDFIENLLKIKFGDNEQH